MSYFCFIGSCLGVIGSVFAFKIGEYGSGVFFAIWAALGFCISYSLANKSLANKNEEN